MSGSLIKVTIFLAWSRQVYKSKLERASPDALWTYNKAKLVEAAVKELQMSRAAAQETSAGQLRLAIKEMRAQMQDEHDARRTAPKGAHKMRKAELEAFCQENHITPTGTAREILIRDILQWAGTSLVPTQSSTNPTDSAPTPSASAASSSTRTATAPARSLSPLKRGAPTDESRMEEN